MNTFVAMDLTHLLPDDARSWIPTYADRMGWEKLKEYYDRVFLRLERMRPGEKLVVWQEVVPDNYDLFCTAPIQPSVSCRAMASTAITSTTRRP